MFQLQVVQADQGDCFILNFGDEDSTKHVLIDGGPKGTYSHHLKPLLTEIRNKGERIDLIVVSHVDDDHICGILELLVDLREQHISKDTNMLKINSLWHNAFDKTIGEGNDIKYRLGRLLQSTGFGQQTYVITNIACYSIAQGVQLNQIFKAFNIPINPESQNKAVFVESMPNEIVNENISLRVVGPTEENLKELRKEWLEWLQEQKAGKKSKNPFFEAMADKSFTNVSSIMILAKSEGKRILFAGDGRGDHLIQGLKKANVLNGKDELEVDVLKLPHHGSIRNVSREFFDIIHAQTYIISAKGENPDFATLKYIVESAKCRRDEITLFATNKTSSTDRLINEYPPTQFGYKLEILSEGANSAFLTP